MGVRSILRKAPLDVAVALVGGDDKRRRGEAQDWLDAYRGEGQRGLARLVAGLFTAARASRIYPFLGIAESHHTYGQIVDDTVGVLYEQPPRREVIPTASQAAWQDLARRCHLDRRLRHACKLLAATGSVAVIPRVSSSLGIVLDVVPASRFAVVPHPDDATVELALVYQVGDKQWCFVDDEEIFVFSADKMTTVGGVVRREAGHPGFAPFVVAHLGERSTDYWEGWGASQRPLYAAHQAVSYLRIMTLRLHRSQSHTQTVLQGDPGNFPGGQVLDEERTMVAGPGNTLGVLSNPTDPRHLRDTEAHIRASAGAAAGIGLSRLGMEDKPQSSTEVLRERRARLLSAMYDLELRLFAKLRDLGGLDGDSELFVVDYPAEVIAGVSRSDQLAIRETERAAGLRSVVDDILEDNPEMFGDRAAAWDKLTRTRDEQARFVEMFRALNQSRDGGDATAPGQTAEENGAMGPAVRDGEMTRDDAAARARKPDPRAIALRVIKGGMR